MYEDAAIQQTIDGRARAFVSDVRERQPRMHLVEDDPQVNVAGRRSYLELRREIERHCFSLEHSPVDLQKLSTDLYYRIGKRLVDIAGASVLLLLTSPLFLIVAAAIRLQSDGPVFFVQQRTGRFGRRFAMYKFRTMVQNAEELKESLRHKNVHGLDSPDFKLVDDPRVTRIGAFLRRTSLDELPNLINVLKGDMSLVGPRPTSFHAVTYESSHLPRLAGKPGITGLWQVSGRANVGFDERTELDVQYLNSVSLLADIRLLLATVRGARDGAY
jgi:lipopolysaccharide/colanic/teichoic acid biosynthesis glycosyltransferase